MRLLQIILLITVSFLLLNFGCKEKPTEPIKEDPDDSLKYQWTIDTLYYTPFLEVNGNTRIHDLWGYSDTSVFAVGRDEHGGAGAMWKFNGQQWSRIKLFTFEGGTFTQALTLNSLLGFSGNNIYAFGGHFYSNPNPPPNFLDSAMAIHFDGVQWKELTIPSGQIMYGGAEYSSNNFYIGGTNGQLFHYYNGQWSVDTVKLSFFPELPYYNVIPVSCSNEGIYLMTVQYNPSDGVVYSQFLLYTEKDITLIDSTTSKFSKWGDNSYWRSPSGKIFSAGRNGIYQFNGNQWKHFYLTENISNIHGTDDNRIFALAYSGNVYYYNGRNWKIISTINKPYPVMGRIWCTNTGVFVSVYHNLRSFIYHGF